MRLLAVNYHYYREERYSSGIYPISRSAFLAQVDGLNEEWQIGGEDTVLNAIEHRQDTTKKFCIVTFDDGLKEQLQAVEWLIARGLSAICFVPTMPLAERRMLDVHKIHMIRSRESDAALLSTLQKSFSDLSRGLDVDMAIAQYRYDSQEAAKLKYLLNFLMMPDQRQAWIDTVFVRLFGSEHAAVDALYMGEPELDYLASRGMLGTHAHSHRPLASLDDLGIRDDIEKSIDILQNITKRRVCGISYPYGGPSAVDARVGQIARQLGLLYGFTMERGINDGSADTGPMLLKRIDTNDVPNFSGVTT